MLKALDEICKPTRGSKYSAAIDLYAKEDVVIGAGETVKVPLGVCIDLEQWVKREIKLQQEESSWWRENTSYEKFNELRNFTNWEYMEKAPQEERWVYQIRYRYENFFLKNHYFQLEPRSSLRAKGLIAGTGIIDLDFVPHCKLNKILKNGHCSNFKQK